MPFQVFLTDDAARDLEDLYDYIELRDVPGKADHVLDQIEKRLTGLSEKSPTQNLPEGITGHRTTGVSRDFL